MKDVWNVTELHKDIALYKKIIIKVLLKFKYKGLPITWEDVYYSFIFYASKKLKGKYQKNLKVPIKKFLSMHCNFFTFNFIKKYLAKKYQILNHYVFLDENDKNLISDNIYDEVLDDKEKILLSGLTKFEFEIYERFFINYDRKSKIAIDLNSNYYHVNRTIEKLKKKLLKRIIIKK